MIDPLEHTGLIAECLTRFRSRSARRELTHEDLAQSAWVGLLTAARKFDGRGEFRGFARLHIAWAVRQEIQRSLWFRLDHERTAAAAAAIRMRRRSIDEFFPARPLVAVQAGGERTPALASLSPRQAQVIELRFGLDGGSGRSVAIVAELLGITSSAVRTHEHRALRKLMCIHVRVAS
jgi:RNA polymerase sigma factor (sigma-70 family)